MGPNGTIFARKSLTTRVSKPGGHSSLLGPLSINGDQAGFGRRGLAPGIQPMGPLGTIRRSVHLPGTLLDQNSCLAEM